jgi:geranylgeranyl pyrophosphate synthase
MTFVRTLGQFQTRVNAALDGWLPKSNIAPERLHEAMRYAALGPGKRIRPALVYATGSALGAELDRLDAAAVAVELIHAYSLVHDDLPAMDNDDLRRGRPTCHRAFDEATAILAGDALQALAFHVLAHDPRMSVSDATRVEMVSKLAVASGSRGMAGGQAFDLAAVGKPVTLVELENMHIHKTGALIRASVLLGAMASGNDDRETHEHLDHFAKCIGLAFQVQDDILDVEGETEVIGKPRGSDAAQMKPTYADLLGLVRAKEIARQLYEDAIASLAVLGEPASILQDLADYIVKRDR